MYTHIILNKTTLRCILQQDLSRVFTTSVISYQLSVPFWCVRDTVMLFSILLVFIFLTFISCGQCGHIPAGSKLFQPFQLSQKQLGKVLHIEEVSRVKKNPLSALCGPQQAVGCQGLHSLLFSNSKFLDTL